MPHSKASQEVKPEIRIRYHVNHRPGRFAPDIRVLLSKTVDGKTTDEQEISMEYAMKLLGI